MKKTRPSILDVARLAGVSPGTVSNALSGKRPVADATRARIQQAIAELNYQPNLLARGMVNQRSYVISIVVRELRDLGLYGYSSAMEGIQQQATAQGYSLMIHFVKDGQRDEVQLMLDQIDARKTDGILWAIHEFDNNRSWTSEIDMDRYPPIVYLNMHPDPALEVVTIDNQQGAALAVEHLVRQGARRVGIITGPGGWWETDARIEGWRQSLRAAGIEPRDEWMVEGDWSSDSGQEAMTELLNRDLELDAVFSSNDNMALGALHIAYHAGLRVPDDLLFAGFDDTPETPSFWPSLTSVKQDMIALGHLAVARLHALIEARNTGKPPATPQQIILPAELVIRTSSVRRG
ncbi:MAG: LacI family DNA-binding transcriptional regulator [Anaerolineaceae bacterium]|nr:LacI family DNA-binding transcriptional regulator [Anaerolineaceae bacterium]